VSRIGGTTRISSSATSDHARLEQPTQLVGGSDCAEHHLGVGGGRNHIRRDAALDETDTVVRAAQIEIDRPFDAARGDEGVDELVNGRLPQLGKARVRRPACRRQPHTVHAACRGGQPIVGRLAVHQIAGSRGERIGRFRAVAAALLAGDEQNTHARRQRGAIARGGDLGGENP
jgi:hypothetical protein